jgi:hypothetical protein
VANPRAGLAKSVVTNLSTTEYIVKEAYHSGVWLCLVDVVSR